MTPDTIIRTTPTCSNSQVLKTWLSRKGIGHAERDLTELTTMDCASRRFGARVQPIIEPRDWFAFGPFAAQKPQMKAQLRAGAA